MHHFLLYTFGRDLIHRPSGAGIALVLISWARGGSLFGGGRGYLVITQPLFTLPLAPAKLHMFVMLALPFRPSLHALLIREALMEAIRQ